MGQFIENILGMPWPVAIFILSAVFLIMDLFFFQGDILTYIVHFMLAAVILHYVPTNNVLLLILSGIAAYGIIFTLHSVVWRKLVSMFFNKIIAPDKVVSANDRLVGKTGVLKLIENRLYVHVGDEYLACIIENNEGTTDVAGQKVVICKWNSDNVLIVKLV